MTCINCGLTSLGAKFCTGCGETLLLDGSGQIAPATNLQNHVSERPLITCSHAPFMVRFFGFVIDEAVAGLLAGLTYGLFTALSAAITIGSLGTRHASGIGVGLLLEAIGVPVALAVYAAYFVMLETSFNQATLGKRLMGIRVTNLQGGRISIGQSLGRLLVKNLFSGLLFLVGFLMAAFTERRQALHDFAASTLVVVG